MESGGAILEAGWSSLDATMQYEEFQLMAQLLGPHPEHSQVMGIPSMLWFDHETGSCYSDGSDSIPHCWPEIYTSTSTTTSNFFSSPSEYPSDSNVIPTMGITSTTALMDFCITEEDITPSSLQFANFQFEDHIYSNKASSDDLGGSSNPIALSDDSSKPKRKFHSGEEDKPISLDQDEIPTARPNKKAKTSAKLRKCGKNAGLEKDQRSVEASNEEESIAALNGQSSSCCSSEDDSNGSQGLINGSGGGSSNHSMKRQGPVTNSQSLYARKRRERINERLKILQNLVPNGTKVDISTMLEEAAQYVKFLQHQIKLLSSDELWMYAPIAYNGLGLGIDLMIPQLQQ